MNHSVIPSLEHIALVKIVTTLWNQEDIINLLKKFNINSEMWPEIENKVIEKVPSLPHPRPLQQQILHAIKPIGNEIFKYIIFSNLDSFKLVINLLGEFSWTQQGTVDRKKMAEALLKNQNIDITERYKLACTYCLRNDIETLWHKMPEVYKKYFYNEDSPYLVEQHSLVVFWTYKVMGQLAKLSAYIRNTPYQYAFELAVYYDNIIAAEYFFNELSPEKREESLITISTNFLFCSLLGYDIVHFLLSKMNEDQQLKMFETCTLRVLLSFLDLPWQSFFIDMANHMWGFLKDQQFCQLLNAIALKIVRGYKDYDYQGLFKQFWKRSPMTLKKYVINQCTRECLLLTLFRARDEKSLSLIFKDATPTEKENIIFHSQSISICKCLARSNEWDLLKFFMSECISSQEKAIKFKNVYREHGEKYYFLQSEENIKVQIFHLLDDVIQKGDKRYLEEKNCTPAKRFCSSSNEYLD